MREVRFLISAPREAMLDVKDKGEEDVVMSSSF